MAWPRVDPVAEIDHLIGRHREDQRAWQTQLSDAVAAELRGIAAVDAARDLEDRCRKAIRDDTDEIDRLFEERDRIVPRARRPIE